MFKRLFLWIVLGTSTVGLLGCGGGSSLDNDGGACEDASTDGCSQPQEPNRCDAVPMPADCVTATDKLTITSPAANSLWSKPEMSFVVKFNGEAPADLALAINGKDVLAKAAISATEAVIAGADVEDLFVNGENSFEAKTGAEADKVVFLYDLAAPRIVVATAVQSSTGKPQQNAGDTLKVSGFVRDVSSITSVKINDVPATLVGSEFTVDVPYNEFYAISATDSSGQSNTLTFAAPARTLDPMLALQVNNSLFRLIQPIIDEVLQNFDGSALVESSEKIALNDKYKVGLTRLDINKAGAPDIDIHFLPSPAEQLVIGVDVTMPLVGMGLEVFSGTNTSPVGVIDADAANIKVTLQLTAAADSSNQLKLGLGSDTPFALTLGTITLNRIDLCGNSCISLANTLNPLFQNQQLVNGLAQMVNKGLVSTLKTALAGMKFPNQTITLPMDFNNDNVKDTALSIDFAPSLLDTDSAQGNGHIELAGRMFVANENLPSGFKGALGSVYVDASKVPAFAGTTAAGKEYDLGVALPSNFLNQAFLALYQSGVMSNIAANIKPSDLGAMGSLLSIIGVGPDDSMRMRLVMGSVPYMQLSHESLGGGRTAGISMHLDNTTIYMDVKKAGGTEYSVLMGMVADISANLELGIDENNYINLGVDNFVDMDVVSVLPVGVADGPLAAAVTPAVIEAQIGPAVKGMLKTETLPAMLKKTTQIAVTMADESQVALKLPLDMGMIMRDLSVDENDAYLVIKLDLLNSDEVKNSTENVPFKINVSKLPPAAQ